MADPVDPSALPPPTDAMMAASVTAKSDPTVMAGEELPDTGMLWRRVISTLLALVGDYLIWSMTTRVSDVTVLGRLCTYLIIYNAVLALFYFSGASAVDVMKIIAAVRTKRSIMENVTKQAQLTGTTTDQ